MQWRFVMLTVFADDHSDYIAVYFSREKGLNDSIPIRKRFKADHARFGNVLKYHSDAAQELMGNTMAGHLDNEGAGRTYGVAGVADRDMDNRAERAIYAITIRARAFRVDAGLPIIHWPLLYLFATFIVNILPIYVVAEKRFTTRLARALGDETYVPYVGHIRRFGCVVHALIPRENRQNKLDPIAISGIFLGFPRYQQGGAVYIWVPSESSKYFVAYSAQFNEQRTYKDAFRLNNRQPEEYFDYEPDAEQEGNTDTPVSSPPKGSSTVDDTNEDTMGSSSGLQSPSRPRAEEGDDAVETITPVQPPFMSGVKAGDEGAMQHATRDHLSGTPYKHTSTRSPSISPSEKAPDTDEGKISSRLRSKGTPLLSKVSDFISGRLRSKPPDDSEVQLLEMQPSMEALIAAHSASLETPLDWQKPFSKVYDEPSWSLHADRFNDTNDQQLQPTFHGMSLGELLELSRARPDSVTSILGHTLVAENSLPRRIKRKKRKAKLCNIGDLFRDIKIPNTIFEVLKHEFCDTFLDAAKRGRTKLTHDQGHLGYDTCTKD